MIYLYIWLGVTAMCVIWSYVHKRWIAKAIKEGEETMTPKLGWFGNIWTKLVLACAFSFAAAILSGTAEGKTWAAIVFVVGATILILGYIWLAFDLFLNWWRGLKATYVSIYNHKLLDEYFHGNFWKQLGAKLTVMGTGAIIIIVSQAL